MIANEISIMIKRTIFHLPEFDVVVEFSNMSNEFKLIQLHFKEWHCIYHLLGRNDGFFGDSVLNYNKCDFFKMLITALDQRFGLAQYPARPMEKSHLLIFVLPFSF